MIERRKKIIDFTQWVLIIAMAVLCYNLIKTTANIKQEIAKTNTDRGILKVQNKTLRDSLKMLNNNKAPTTVKYKMVYRGDTTYVDRQLSPIEENVYIFSETKGALRYQIKIKAKNISWYKIDVTIKEKLLFTRKRSE